MLDEIRINVREAIENQRRAIAMTREASRIKETAERMSRDAQSLSNVDHVLPGGAQPEVRLSDAQRAFVSRVLPHLLRAADAIDDDTFAALLGAVGLTLDDTLAYDEPDPDAGSAFRYPLCFRQEEQRARHRTW